MQIVSGAVQVDADVGLRLGLNLCGGNRANMWKVYDMYDKITIKTLTTLYL